MTEKILPDQSSVHEENNIKLSDELKADPVKAIKQWKAFTGKKTKKEDTKKDDSDDLQNVNTINKDDEKETKSNNEANKNILIGFGIFVFIILGIGIFVGYLFFGNNDSNEKIVESITNDTNSKESDTQNNKQSIDTNEVVSIENKENIVEQQIIKNNNKPNYLTRENFVEPSINENNDTDYSYRQEQHVEHNYKNSNGYYIYQNKSDCDGEYASLEQAFKCEIRDAEIYEQQLTEILNKMDNKLIAQQEHYSGNRSSYFRQSQEDWEESSQEFCKYTASADTGDMAKVKFAACLMKALKARIKSLNTDFKNLKDYKN